MKDHEPSLARAIRGPITLITVGVLFALNNFTQYTFDKTWPVLLIVFGLLSLLKRGMEPALPPQPPVFPPPQYTYPAAQGSYAQSTYAQPVPVSAKGGFGASAPRPAEGGQIPPVGPGGQYPPAGPGGQDPPAGQGGQFPPAGTAGQFPPAGTGAQYPPRGPGESA